MQLTLLLPILLNMYNSLSRMKCIIFFSSLFSLFYILNASLIASKDIGVIPFFNLSTSEPYYDADYRFYSEIFIKPWYHFNSYLTGVLFCLVVIHKRTYAIVDIYLRRSLYRYSAYFFGLALILVSFFGMVPYL